MKIRILLVLLVFFPALYSATILVTFEDETEGKSFNVETLQQLGSVTINNLLVDIPIVEDQPQQQLPLPNIKVKIFEFIVNNRLDFKNPPALAEKLKKISGQDLIAILLTANYLDIPPLLEAVLKEVGNRWLSSHEPILNQQQFTQYWNFLQKIPVELYKDLIKFSVWAQEVKRLITDYFLNITRPKIRGYKSQEANLQLLNFSDDNTIAFLEDLTGVFKIRQWNVQTNKFTEKEEEELSIEQPENFDQVIMSPDGNYYAIIDEGDVYIIDKKTQEITHKITGSKITNLSWAADSKSFVYLSAAGVNIYSVEAGQSSPVHFETEAIVSHYGMFQTKAVAWNRATNQIFILVSHAQGHQLLVLEAVAPYAIVKNIPLTYKSVSTILPTITFSTNYKYIGITFDNKYLVILSLENYKPLLVSTTAIPLQAIAFHPDNQHITLIESFPMLTFGQDIEAKIVFMDFLNGTIVQELIVPRMAGHFSSQWNKSGDRFAMSDSFDLFAISFDGYTNFNKELEALSDLRQLQLLSYMVKNNKKKNDLPNDLQKLFAALPMSIQNLFK